MWDYSTLQFVSNQLPVEPPATLVQLPVEAEQRATQARLGQRKKSRAAAIALWWDAGSVKVLCPYCHKKHNHGIDHFARGQDCGRPIQDAHGRYTYDGPSQFRCESRCAHCNHDSRIQIPYTILFPFEDDIRVNGLSFEIQHATGDRLEGYCTVGIHVPESRHCMRSENEEERETRLHLQKLDMEDGDFIVRTDISCPTDPERDEISDSAVELIIASAVEGDTEEMKSLLSKSPNPQSLLKARDEEGTSLLSFAVCKGRQETVNYLLKRDVDVNAVDCQGRTPLMEAAVWVHPVIVSTLLKAGASRSMKDKVGLTAGDFVEESEANDEERHKRAREYSENPFVAKRHRRLIKGLLGHTFPRNAPKSIPLDDLADAHFYKSKKTSTISFVIPRTGVHILTQSKTAAFLNRGSPFPVVSAVSGRSGPDDQEFLPPGDGFEKLNCQYWMPEAMRVAREFGFEFETNRFDKPGVPGSYYAGHAESMLMCFFINRNYIFRKYEEEEIVRDDFLQLFLLQQRVRQAQILVSKSPCNSCLALRDYVQSSLGIYFDLKEIQVRGEV